MDMPAITSSGVRQTYVSSPFEPLSTSFASSSPALRSDRRLFQKPSPQKQISRKITSHAFVATNGWLLINIKNDKPVLKWRDGWNLNVFLFYYP
jgi:hypothetical protein